MAPHIGPECAFPLIVQDSGGWGLPFYSHAWNWEGWDGGISCKRGGECIEHEISRFSQYKFSQGSGWLYLDPIETLPVLIAEGLQQPRMSPSAGPMRYFIFKLVSEE